MKKQYNKLKELINTAFSTKTGTLMMSVIMLDLYVTVVLIFMIAAHSVVAAILYGLGLLFASFFIANAMKSIDDEENNENEQD